MVPASNPHNLKLGFAYGSAHKLVHILFAKCPVFWGLLRIDYVKLFMNDPDA